MNNIIINIKLLISIGKSNWCYG